MPDEFIQFGKSNNLKPDFVLSYSKDQTTYFIILDAKYKMYTGYSRDIDFSTLTLKYLDKLGVNEYSKSRVIALFSVSLSEANMHTSIFSSIYDLNSTSPRYPHIGNIALNPISFKIDKNPLKEVLDLLFDKIN